MLERLGPGERYRSPTAEDLARSGPQAQGARSSRTSDWVSRSDPEAKIAKMKDGTHAPGLQARALRSDLDTGAVVVAELHPADEGDTTTLPKTLAAAEANLEVGGCGADAEDPAECVDKGIPLTVGLDQALDDRRLEEPDVRASSSRVLRAGTEMMRLAGRSPTTGPGCYRGWPGKPSSCAPRSSSAPLPTTSIAAVCAGPGFGAARTCTSDRASRRRPQPIVADAPTHRRRHPEGGRGGRNWRLVRACYARWSRPGRSDRPHRLRGWRNCLRRDMLRRGVKPGQ